jgi:hypothetical protein
MARVTKDEFAEKWSRRLKGAVEDIRAGIEKVNEAPTGKAASKQDKMKARLVAAIDSGKWANALKSVTLDEWKKKTLEKGVNRISAGVDLSADKVAKFAEQLLAYQDGLKKEIEKLPDITIEDAVNRAATWIRGMSKFKKK